MFGCRQDGSSWRLCIKYGEILHGTVIDGDGNWLDFTFPNRAKAFACAEELNKRFWYEYEKHRSGHTLLPHLTATEMINTIRTFGDVVSLPKPKKAVEPQLAAA